MWAGAVRGDFKEILEMHLYLKRHMHQCKESILGKMNNKGIAKEAEIEWDMWVGVLMGDALTQYQCCMVE